MPFSKGKIFKNHLQGFGRWIRVRVRAYLRVPDLHAPYLIAENSIVCSRGNTSKQLFVDLT